jgi:SAM-dependent methyltransferase
MSSIARTAQFWSDQEVWRVGRGFYWLELPAVQRRLSTKVSGDPHTDWVAYTLENYMADRLPVDRCLSLGCGKGGLERQLAGMGTFTVCDAYDVAPGSVEEARRLATAQGCQHIRYEMADINYLELPAQTYDLVWVSGAMHHFEPLEYICAQMHQSLKPQGLLVLNEYVGPSRFQFPPRQREIIQAVLTLLPRRYRRLAPQRVEDELARSPGRRNVDWLLHRFVDKIRDRELLATLQRRWASIRASQQGNDLFKTTLSLPTVRDVIAADPSEAIRSQDILRVVAQFFEVVEIKELGGGLLQFLLDGIACNFSDDDPPAMEMLALLFEIEDRLMACGELKSDFVYLVARPRKN